jgi:hypothetical protein
MNIEIAGVELQVTVTVSPFSFIDWSHPKSVLFETDSNGSEKF